MRRDERGFAVRLERTYEATLEEVWAAFTDPASIRRWLFADTILEPRVGGRAEFRWSDSDGNAALGVVLAWDPPRMLELSWGESDPPSVLRVELTALGATTRLVLEHGGIAVEGTATGLGAGWHAHLTALRDVLDG
jgi:uncharacterized protein YndB with AHSA1/START domain